MFSRRNAPAEAVYRGNARTADLAAAVKFTARLYPGAVWYRVLHDLRSSSLRTAHEWSSRGSDRIASRQLARVLQDLRIFRRPVVLAARRVHPVQGPAPGHGVNPNRVPSHGNDCEPRSPHAPAVSSREFEVAHVHPGSGGRGQYSLCLRAVRPVRATGDDGSGGVGQSCAREDVEGFTAAKATGSPPKNWSTVCRRVPLSVRPARKYRGTWDTRPGR